MANGTELQIGTRDANGGRNVTGDIGSRKREVAYKEIDSRGRRNDVL